MKIINKKQLIVSRDFRYSFFCWIFCINNILQNELKTIFNQKRFPFQTKKQAIAGSLKGQTESSAVKEFSLRLGKFRQLLQTYPEAYRGQQAYFHPSKPLKPNSWAAEKVSSANDDFIEEILEPWHCEIAKFPHLYMLRNWNVWWRPLYEKHLALLPLLQSTSRI